MLQRSRQRGQRLPLRRCHICAARHEVYGTQLLIAGTDQTGQQAEGRRDDIGNDIGQRPPNDLAVVELRVVDITADRHLQIDHPVAILEERNRQPKGKIERVRMRHSFAEHQIPHHQRVIATELAVVDAVGKVNIEITVVNASACKLDDVGRHRRDVEIAEAQIYLGQFCRRERAQLPADGYQPIFVNLPLQVHSRWLGRARRQCRDLPRQASHVDRERQRQRLIRKIGAAILDGDVLDGDGQQLGPCNLLCAIRSRNRCRCRWRNQRTGDIVRATLFDLDTGIGLTDVDIADVYLQLLPGRHSQRFNSQAAQSQQRLSLHGVGQGDIVHCHRPGKAQVTRS